MNALQAEDNEFSKLFGDKEATQYRKIHKDLLKFWQEPEIMKEEIVPSQKNIKFE